MKPEWEWTKEWRSAKKGEFFSISMVDMEFEAQEAFHDLEFSVYILRKIKEVK